MSTIPAISLHQPWASLIAIGVKRIETRSWRAPAKYAGQRIAIHAAKRLPNTAAAMDVGDYQVHPDGAGGWSIRHQPTSRLVGPGANLLATLDPAGIGRRYGYHVLPLGAVVCTARLVECLPMVAAARQAGENAAAMLRFLGDRLVIVRQGASGYSDTDVTDQRPYGDFAAGRWAWMLDQVEPLEQPISWTGRQGWFTVDLP